MIISTIKHHRAFALLVSLIITLLSVTGCQSKDHSPISKSSFYLDTVITITLYDTDDNDLLNQGMKL